MDDITNKYALMVSFLGNTLGGSCEAYLLDLRQKSLPIVAQHNLHRGSVGPLRRLVREALQVPRVLEEGILLNRAVTSDTEKLIKCSLYFIKDGEGQPAAVLCLVVRLQTYLEMYTYLDELIRLNNNNLDEEQPDGGDALLEEPSLELIDRMVAEFTEDPQRMRPDEKTELILDLYDAGVFELKGSVAKAADAIGMSEQSIYRYLSKIRKNRE